MKRETAFEIGQHFQDARITAFGARLRTVWVVDRVWEGSDRIEYVRLVREDYSGESKTISARALADRKLFLPDVARSRDGDLQSTNGRRFWSFKPFSAPS